MISLLRPGDHFGEISLLYNCPRTAIVRSRNYNTIAKLSQAKFKNFVSDYPEYEDQLKLSIQIYNDCQKNFLLETIKRIPYFNGISIEALHAVIYCLKKRYYQRGEMLFNVDDHASSVFLVQEGQISLYTFFEGHEFELERL